MSTAFTSGGATDSDGVWATLRALNSTQRNALLASYLGWMLDAFDFFILVMVVGPIAKDFHTAEKTITYAIFLTLAMRPLGALVFGFLADRYGRRPTLMFNVAFFSIMELLSGFAPTLGWLIVLRALFGFGMGGEWGVGASLVMETVPAKTRGILSGILQEGYPVGYLLAAVVYKCVYPYGGWRWMFFVGFLPALLALYIRGAVEESPAWEHARQRRTADSFGSTARRMWEAVRTHWKLFLFLTALMTAFNFFSHGTQDLYPSLFLEGQRKIPKQTVGNIAIVYNLGALCGGILFGAWSQRIGRRRAILIASLFALPVIPAWAYCATPVSIAVAAFFMQFAVQGAWGVVPAHLNELSPAALRGTFPGLAYQVGNLLAAYTTPLQSGIAKAHGGDYGYALAITVACAAVVLATASFFSPEAKETDLVTGDTVADTLPAS